MSISNLHHESFHQRLEVSDNYTKILVGFLERKKHFKIIRKANFDEEKEGIDWFVQYPDKEKPSAIQFKLRDKRNDIPVVRYQPLYGLDDDRNVEGRDYRGLFNKSCENYYVAIRNSAGLFNSIYYCKSAALRKAITNLEKEWEAAENVGSILNKAFFIRENVVALTARRNKKVFTDSKGLEIWWKKNPNEGNPKLNIYIPHSYREWEIDIKHPEALQIENVFKKLAGKA